MLVYLLNRWVLARRFTKVEGGYAYRRRSDLPGFLVTEQERKSLLGEFRRRYWKTWFLMLACILAGAGLTAVVAIVFGLGESFVEWAAYTLIAALLAFIVWEQRAWSLLPERHFAKCPQIEPEWPSSGWFGRFHDMMRDRSWKSHTALFLLNGFLAWVFSLNLSEAKFGQWLLFIAFTAAAIISLYGAVHKVRSKG